MNVHGNDYGRNDHVSLACDVAELTRLGFQVWPLHRIVHAWRYDRASLEGRRIAGLSCDDGSDFDFRDLDHPSWGAQRSMLNVLRDFARRRPRAQPTLHMTAFVIVSPEARGELDRACMVGRGWWNEDWWPWAAQSGLMAIGNHSWDHNHEAVARTPGPGLRRGSFAPIDTPELADYEIRQADAYLRARVPSASAALFAYPYGESNDFLSKRYFPSNSQRFAAAFTTEPEYLTGESDAWRLPRFTCGLDWKTPEGFRRLLAGALAG